MGSVSRGRWKREAWGAPSLTNGMAWLLATILLSLLTVGLARPPLTAAREEATLEPEGELQKKIVFLFRGGRLTFDPFLGFSELKI